MNELSRLGQDADKEVVMSQLVSANALPCTEDAELDLARQIQSAFVPVKCFGWPGTHVAARRISSAGLGGDFHTVVHGLDEKCSLVVGTVAGPGLFAALAKAVLSGAVGRLGPTSPPPGTVLDQLRRVLDHINSDLREGRVTCSVFHGLVDRVAGTMEYCNAGHCRPLAWTRDGEMKELRTTRPPLGEPGSHGFESESIRLANVQRLIVCSDGLNAARSAKGEPFGASRGKRLINDTVPLPADEQVDEVLRVLRDHVGTDSDFSDDATVFVTEFSEPLTTAGTDSMRTWFSSYEQASGVAPDSSVYLG
jgi:serine phosphatase RsbU (regulator of sigma subunit)